VALLPTGTSRILLTLFHPSFSIHCTVTPLDRGEHCHKFQLGQEISAEFLELVQPEYKTELSPVRLRSKIVGKIFSALMYKFTPRFINLSSLQFLGIYQEEFSIKKLFIFNERDFYTYSINPQVSYLHNCAALKFSEMKMWQVSRRFHFL
jgi:hypothetical protein